MPLTSKGEEVLAAMRNEYGSEEGERVFYAARNAGTISGVDSDEVPPMAVMDNMAEQINSLGQEAKRLVERMDASWKDTVKTAAPAIAERLNRGEQDFVNLIMSAGGLSSSQAWKAFEVLRKAKAVKRDAYSGKWSVTHGAYWERDVLRRAAGIEK